MNKRNTVTKYRPNCQVAINPVLHILETKEYYYVCGSDDTYDYLKHPYYSPFEHSLIITQPIIEKMNSGIVRLNKNGFVDMSWNNSMQDDIRVTAFDTLPGGFLVIAVDSVLSRNHSLQILDTGINSNINKSSKYNILRNNLVNAHMNKEVKQILWKDNKIYIISSSDRYNEKKCNPGIIRLNEDGSIDTSFLYQRYNIGFNGIVNCIDFQNDNKIIVFGDFWKIDNNFCSRSIIRLFNNGCVDESFESGIGFRNTVLCGMVLKDNSIIVGGKFVSYDSDDQISHGLCKLKPNGKYDSTFNKGNTGFRDYNGYCIENKSIVSAIAKSKYGGFLIGGVLKKYNGQSINTPIISISNNGDLLSSSINSDLSVFSNIFSALRYFEWVGEKKVIILQDGK